MWKIIFVCTLCLCSFCDKYALYEKRLVLSNPVLTNIYVKGKLISEIHTVELGRNDTSSLTDEYDFPVDFSIIKKGDTLFIDRLFPFMVELHKKTAL